MTLLPVCRFTVFDRYYMNLQPIVASVVAIFVGQDVFSWDKPIAAVLVIAGAYVVTTSRAKVSEEGAHSQSE